MSEDKLIQEKQRLQAYQDAYSTLIARNKLQGMLGESFDGDRDLYKALGYARHLSYTNYYMQYSRQDIAEAVIDRPIEATWSGDIEILESDDDNDTPLEKEFRKLVQDHQLKDKFIRLDRLTNLGRYGVLLMGLDDAKTKQEALLPVKGGKRKLMYLKPLSEESAKPVTWDTLPGSPRYGLPVLYDITISSRHEEQVQMTLRVHHTRLLHITGKKMESEVYGIPYLRSIFNRLTDLEKLTGGSAEMFWRNARPGFQANVKDNYTLGIQGEDELSKQAAEYENHLRRIFTVEGVELKALTAQVSDPKSHIDSQIALISAKTGIPKRQLTGSERGELASSQDADAWKELIQNRRDEFAVIKILRPVVDRFIELGILPVPKDKYTVKWSDLFAPSEKDKAEVGKTRAQALKEYVSQPGAQEVMPMEAFMQFFLGLSEEQVALITEMREQALRDEEQDFADVDEEEIERQDINESNQEEDE